jgi:hypothetical protein
MDYASRVAVSILLGFIALVVGLLHHASLAGLVVALLIGLAAVLVCPSPP